MGVDARFVINLKGKDFVLLGGLLDLGHNMGLQSIETDILGEFSLPAEQRWVVRAIGTFRTENGSACWSAIGDAAPDNSQMRGAYLRHAETRAVARMLRFATNVSMTAFEELGPDADEQPRSTANGQATRPLVRHERTADTTRANRRQNAAPAPAASGYVAEGEADLICSWPDCGTGLTKNQQTISQHKVKMSLCPTHLKELLSQPAGK